MVFYPHCLQSKHATIDLIKFNKNYLTMSFSYSPQKSYSYFPNGKNYCE